MTANSPSPHAVSLRECPFCGGEAEIIHLDDGDNAGGSCVCCTSCQASGNVEFGRKENFVENWNRRASPADGVVVPRERLQFAIDVIAHLKPHKARLVLEQALESAASPALAATSVGGEEIFGVTGASGEVEALACALWAHRCPGILMHEEDMPHYTDAARAAFSALDEATPPSADADKLVIVMDGKGFTTLHEPDEDGLPGDLVASVWRTDYLPALVAPSGQFLEATELLQQFVTRILMERRCNNLGVNVAQPIMEKAQAFLARLSTTEAGG